MKLQYAADGKIQKSERRVDVLFFLFFFFLPSATNELSFIKIFFGLPSLLYPGPRKSTCGIERTKIDLMLLKKKVSHRMRKGSDSPPR